MSLFLFKLNIKKGAILPKKQQTAKYNKAVTIIFSVWLGLNIDILFLTLGIPTFSSLQTSLQF